jgi:hypothetical protein
MHDCVVCSWIEQGVTFGPAQTNQALVVAACVLVGICFVAYSLVVCIMVSVCMSPLGVCFHRIRE